MPRSRKLTWQPGTHGRSGRWRKKFRGHTYYFPGGRGKSDKTAYEAAERAWERKKIQLQAVGPKPRQAEYEAAIAQWELVFAWSRKHDDAEWAEIATEKLELLRKRFAAQRPKRIPQEDTFEGQVEARARNPDLEQAVAFLADHFEPLPVSLKDDGNSTDTLHQFVAELIDLADASGAQTRVVPTPEADGRVPALQVDQAIWQDRLDVMQRGQVPQDQTLQVQSERFLASKQAKVAAGGLSVGRYDLVQKHISQFATWMGSDSAITDIDGRALADFHQDLMKQVKDGDIARATAKDRLSTVKTFVRWLWHHELIPQLPRIMDSQELQIEAGHAEIVTFTVAEVKKMLSDASDRTRLYLLLMLNCGMTQKDIADLLESEVDWNEGRITRKRSKTKKHEKVPTVSYKLWPETLRLLKKERSGSRSHHVLVNRNGQPLWQEKTDDDGTYQKIDNVKSAYRRLCKKLDVDKPLKSLKKTSASLLRNNEKYSSLETLFLGHAPRTMADRHYAKSPQELLDEATDWLATKYGLSVRAAATRT